MKNVKFWIHTIQSTSGFEIWHESFKGFEVLFTHYYSWSKERTADRGAAKYSIMYINLKLSIILALIQHFNHTVYNFKYYF